MSVYESVCIAEEKSTVSMSTKLSKNISTGPATIVDEEDFLNILRFDPLLAKKSQKSVFIKID